MEREQQLRDSALGVNEVGEGAPENSIGVTQVAESHQMPGRSEGDVV